MANSSTAQWPAAIPNPDRQDPYLRILFVTIFVRDQGRSLRFYSDQLGFNLVFDNQFEGDDRFLVVAPPDGTAVLALVRPETDSEEYKLIGRAPDVVFITEDVVAKYEEWCKRGVRFLQAPQKPIWGGLFASFQDVDGNSLKLVGADDFVTHLDAQRRSLAKRQESERRAAQELEIAKQVQARLFPQSQPLLKTLDYAGICIQARQVGGDYYDFLDLGRKRLGLVIGDISGKGMPAALLMVNLQANLRSQSAIAIDEPQRLLRSVNQLFYDNTPDSAYASLFFAEYDDRAQCLRYANCGHLPALLLRSDGTLERLDSTCTLLGLFNQWDCYMGERQLYSGDTLVLYTDGITESFNRAQEEFGEERLVEVFQRHRKLLAQDLLSAIVEEVRQFSPQEQHDDITLIVAKCREE
jgi:serine phosphatase RsbU (regulator of sigma subunit)/predicted enzyme related to lactoylglutathione lyase